MKRNTWILLTVVVVVVAGVLTFGLTTKASGSCNGVTGAKLQITIKNNKASDENLNGKLCDTLTFVNQDDTERLIAFGPHDHHQPYDGVTERELTKGQSFTITLNKVGTYTWHDHLHDDQIHASFTVVR